MPQLWTREQKEEKSVCCIALGLAIIFTLRGHMPLIGNVQSDQRVIRVRHRSLRRMVHIYQTGKSAHNHQVEAGAFTAAQVMATVKTKALEDKFRPASATVEEVHILIQFNNCKT